MGFFQEKTLHIFAVKKTMYFVIIGAAMFSERHLCKMFIIIIKQPSMTDGTGCLSVCRKKSRIISWQKSMMPQPVAFCQVCVLYTAAYLRHAGTGKPAFFYRKIHSGWNVRNKKMTIENRLIVLMLSVFVIDRNEANRICNRRHIDCKSARAGQPQ